MTSSPSPALLREKMRMIEVAVTGVRMCAFFFQAEDGIRDVAVTGVQTCALPIYEQDVPGLEGREQADQVAGALEHGSRGGADVHAELARHEQRERRLPEPRRSEEQRVVERLLALLRRVDGDLERLLDLGLADELVQARGAQRRVRDALVGERLRRGDLNPRLRHSITLTPPACCSRAARATEPAGGPPPARGVCDR